MEIIDLRKKAYYSSIYSDGLAQIYKEFLSADPPFIPRKFQEKPYPGESEIQRNRRKQLETTKIEMEIERLEEEAAKHNSNMDTCESHLKEHIKEVKDASARQGILELWFETIAKEQSKSDKIWEKKKEFFLSWPQKSQSSRYSAETRNEYQQNSRIWDNQQMHTRNNERITNDRLRQSSQNQTNIHPNQLPEVNKT